MTNIKLRHLYYFIAVTEELNFRRAAERLHIAQNLPLNKVTTVEFTPTQPESYEFACGMNMFRRMIKVETSNAPSKEKLFSQASA